jgi:hypothetical protein
MDPDNPGLAIGRTTDKRIGRCVIESVSETTSIARAVEGEGFAIKHIVRFPAAKSTTDVPAPAERAGKL